MNEDNYNNPQQSTQPPLEQSDNQQPVAQPPVYQQPVAQPPVYQQPVAQPPVYQQPVYPVYQQPVYQPVQAQPVTPKSAMITSIIALVLGICSLCTFYVGIAFGIAGLILSSISTSKNNGQPLPKAKTGKILSIVGLIVSVVWLIVFIVSMAALFQYA